MRARPPAPASQLLAEIKIHRSLQHRFVVGFDSFFEDRTNVYIMLELCTSQVRRARRHRAAPRALVLALALALALATLPSTASSSSSSSSSPRAATRRR